MKKPVQPLLEGEAPLVSLRARRLVHIREEGHRDASSTVFCPARERSTEIDTCRAALGLRPWETTRSNAPPRHAIGHRATC
jgi:hypothetical protein